MSMTDNVTFSDSDEVQAYVVVGTYDTDDEAREQATLLVEHGIGGIVEAVVVDAEPVEGDEAEGIETEAPADTDDSEVVVFELRVLPEQAERAYDALGCEAPAEVRAETAKSTPPWKTILIIWAIAMVVIPVTAGYLTYVILSRP